ncbi:MAG: hydroxymethylbilane synthase [Myxococcota bacterium]|nr:hydroxymethylbilane synthase [Myxococcota bacterium]
MTLRIATRRSALALAQTRWVAARIRALHPDVPIEEVHVVTEGDRVLDRPLSAVGGKGLFVAEVEAALRDGRADLAVHSMKDVPAELAPGCAIVAVPEREDPRDVLVTPDGAELDALPAAARVGTSSLRRVCQLRRARPDLDYATLRGNVDTRLRRLDEGRFAAIVVALAGLRRLDLATRPLRVLSPELCIPAAGQGALALEAREDDERVRALVAPLDDPRTRASVDAERAFLARLEGGCKTPIAAHLSWHDGGARVRFDAMVASFDGERMLTGSSERWTEPHAHAGPPGRLADTLREMALEVAEALLSRGAGDLVREARAAAWRAQTGLS